MVFHGASCRRSRARSLTCWYKISCCVTTSDGDASGSGSTCEPRGRRRTSESGAARDLWMGRAKHGDLCLTLVTASIASKALSAPRNCTRGRRSLVEGVGVGTGGCTI